MKVEGEREFEASRETVWQVLNTPETMAKLIPGVESFEITDERHWQAKVKIPLGLGGLSMSMSFEKIEERQPEYAKLNAKGSGVGAMLNMETQFHLTEAGRGTHMRWEAEVRIAGPVGSMGQRVLQPIINQQVGSVLGALERQIEAAAGDHPPAATGDSGASVAPATGSAGTPAPTTERPAPATDPTVKDAGPPADGPADPAGSSGAQEGLNPWAPESYRGQPEGPTTSTEDAS